MARALAVSDELLSVRQHANRTRRLHAAKRVSRPVRFGTTRSARFHCLENGLERFQPHINIKSRFHSGVAVAAGTGSRPLSAGTSLNIGMRLEHSRCTYHPMATRLGSKHRGRSRTRSAPSQNCIKPS
jgi:hypothetical protein